MAISGFEELMATILLMAIPDPMVWVILFMLGLILGLAISKTNGTTAVLLLFIAVHTITEFMGGIMHMVRMIMYIAVGFSLVLALMKIGNR